MLLIASFEYFVPPAYQASVQLEKPGNDFLDLRASDWVYRQLALFHLGLELGISYRLLKGFAQKFYLFFRRAGGKA